MSLATIWPFAWKEFIRRKSRFITSIAGFSLSVIVFVVVLAVLQQSRKSLGLVLTHTGTHFIAYKPQCCAPPFLSADANAGFSANGQPSQPLPMEILSTIRGFSTVADASPFLSFKFMENNQTVTIGGFDPANGLAVANTSCSASDIVSGRFLQPQDSGKVMVDQSLAILRDLNSGSTIDIHGESLEIVGIVNPGIRPARVDVYMTFADAEKVISRFTAMPVRNLMNIVLVESANAHVHRQAMADVQQVLGKTGLISSYGCYQPASKALVLHAQALQLLSIMIFIFAALLAMQTQFAAIQERRREIGILSSMGWSRLTIAKLICYQSMIPAVLGGVIGAVVSILMIYFLPLHRITGLQASEPVAIPVMLLLIAMGFIGLGGLLAGLVPGWIATRKLPVHNLHMI